VTEVGNGVKKFKVGDKVYARLPEIGRGVYVPSGLAHQTLTLEPGSWAEYCTCPEAYVALQPKTLSHEDVASLPLAAVTAVQAFRKYRGSLEGRTVFVPAGRK
jgi:NADPH:quinone reductase-like Zn-dependent oxidoreductase